MRENHPALNDALRQAVRIASNKPIERKADARIWYDLTNDTVGVADSSDPRYGDQTLETVAYVQRWDEHTVEIRSKTLPLSSQWVPRLVD